MESPEKIEAMIKSVPPVHPAIEEYNAEEEARGPGWAEPIEKAQVMVIGKACRHAPEGNDGEAGEQRIGQPEEQVADTMATAVTVSVREQRKKRCGGFPDQQREEQGESEAGSEQLQGVNLLVHS